MMATVGCVETDMEKDEPLTVKGCIKDIVCKLKDEQHQSEVPCDKHREPHDSQSDDGVAAPVVLAQATATATTIFAKPSIPTLRSRQLQTSFKQLRKTAVIEKPDEVIARGGANGLAFSIRTRSTTNTHSHLTGSRNKNHHYSNSKGSSLKYINSNLKLVSGSTGNNNSSFINCSNCRNSGPTIRRDANCVHDPGRPKSSIGADLSRIQRMGVLCLEKQCGGGNLCCCGDASAKSPRPASLPSSTGYSPKRCAVLTKNDLVLSKKRPLDVCLDTAVPIVRRRTQRSPSAGTINGTNCHLIRKDHLTLQITSLTNQNGCRNRHEHTGVNGFNIPLGFVNGSRAVSCLGLDIKSEPNCSIDQSSEYLEQSDLHSQPSNSSSFLSPSPSPSSPSSSTPSSSSASSPPVLSQHCEESMDASSVSSSDSNVTDLKTESDGSTSDTNIFLKASNLPTSNIPLLPSLHSSEESVPSAINLQEEQLQSSAQVSRSTIPLKSDCCRVKNLSGDHTQTAQYAKCIPVSTSSNLQQRSFSDNCNLQQSSSNISFSGVEEPGTVSSFSTILSTKTVQSLSSVSSSSSMSSMPSSPSALKDKDLTYSTASSDTNVQTESSSPSQTPNKLAECKWRGCSVGNLDASNLLEHIRQHAETQIARESYACLWLDCKVYNKPSWSGSWLERHVVSHSGHRPFKCILDNCGQGFHSQAALERHVNSHFAAQAKQGSSYGRSKEEGVHRLLQRRKRQLKRRSVQTVTKSDLFDEETMTVVKKDLLTLTGRAQLELINGSLNATFHGQMIGRRMSKGEEAQSLVQFHPCSVIEDHWLPESAAAAVSDMSIPVQHLPHDSVTNLHSSLYRRHRFRKHRRK